MVAEFILLLALVCLNAFLSAAEVAIAEVRKSRLAQWLEEGHGAAKSLERLAQDSSRTLATLQLGTTLASFLAVGTASLTLAPRLALDLARAAWLAPYSLLLAVLIVASVLGLVMLVLGEMVPKSLAARHAELLALVVARPLDMLASLFAPLVKVLVWLSNLIAAPLGGAARASMGAVTEEEIRTVVDAGEEGGVLEEQEKEMIYSIFDLGDTLTREVMVPRMDMVALDAATPLAEAADVVIKAMHSRVPVYQGAIDEIVGVLYAKDLLRVLRTGNVNVTLAQLVRPVYFVPEAKKAGELLKELQKRRVHMAVVVDEYGGVAGLVTIEDILEEIVGEIQDEYDTGEEPLCRQVDEDEYIFDARVNLEKVREALHIALPASEAYDTLGGFLYAQLGQVPTQGEQIKVEGLVIQVLEIFGRRIGKVRVWREPPVAQES